jgi:predicted ATPase/DNA-binding CsgD family transcriptional regulator
MSSALAGRLPEEITSFVGRKREVTYAKRMFGLTRLVTLTGVGGVGKTRLAIRLARQARRTFPDGICYVPLADLRDPALLRHTIATALGLHEYSDGDPQFDPLIEYLSTRRLLLVLDNCEHLLAFCADFVEPVLRSCPDIRVLTTSREPLGIAGESTLPVPPLPIPELRCPRTALAQYEAVGLFLDRAASAVPGFELTESNHHAVAELCRNLDGLPLALELAAVRLRALSPEQILTRLADRYELLAAPGSAPARQRTLGALMTWSFDLCSADEQLLWMRLSVFSGGIELEAAEGICTDLQIATTDILGLLVSLVDKSVLMREERDGRVRYRLLETVREFGQHKLRGAGELLTWRRRHRDWYSDLVKRAISCWSSAGQTERLDRLRSEHANIRAALDFCVGQPREVAAGLDMAGRLYFYWLTGGLLSEGRHWIDLMLGSLTDSGPIETKGLFVGASLATLCGDMTSASLMLDKALESAEKNHENHAYVDQGRGLLALFTDDLDEAVSRFEVSLRTFERVDDVTGTAFTFFLYGLATALSGQSEKTAEAHRRCQELTESNGETWIWSCSLWTVGVDAWRRGDYAESTRLLHSALRMKRPLNDHLGIAECIESIAWVAATQRRYARAATLLGAADTGWRQVGMPLRTLPGLHRHHAECERIAHSIGARPYETAYRAGSRMPLDEAISFALEEGGIRPVTIDSVALTPREMEIAELIGQGMSNKEIAAALVVSRRTVEAHVQHAMAKLAFGSRAQVAAWVAGRGVRQSA